MVNVLFVLSEVYLPTMLLVLCVFALFSFSLSVVVVDVALELMPTLPPALVVVVVVMTLTIILNVITELDYDNICCTDNVMIQVLVKLYIVVQFHLRL